MQNPLVRVLPEGQEVHWLLAAPEQVAQEVWQDWHWLVLFRNWPAEQICTQKPLLRL